MPLKGLDCKIVVIASANDVAEPISDQRPWPHSDLQDDTKGRKRKPSARGDGVLYCDRLEKIFFVTLIRWSRHLKNDVWRPYWLARSKLE